MRPDARGSPMEASFKAEQTSGGEGACQTDRNVDAVLRQRDLSMAVRSASNVSAINRAAAITFPKWALGAKSVIQPDGMLDDLGRKTVAVIGDGVHR